MNITPPSDPRDKQAWREYVAHGQAGLAQMMAANLEIYPAEIVELRAGDTALYDVAPASISPSTEDCAIFYIHGGAFIHGSGITAAHMALPLASTAGLRALSVDYRMPPDHPFPVGLDDCIAAYRVVIERFDPARLAVAGGSAGGGLAASFVLKARDLGLPLPGACVLDTPEADLTESGDTFETLADIDVVIRRRLTESIAVYADDHDLTDPYLSPLFGDFSQGFPPTILTSGTRDMFLSNTVRFHRALLAARQEAELHVWEARPHGGFFGAPEDAEVTAQQAEFILRKLAAQ